MARNSSFLGVDLGSAGLKVVELANDKKRPKLITYGFSENLVNLSQIGFTPATLEVAKVLKEICVQAKTTSRQVVASLPSFDVYTSIITLPKLEKKELKEAVFSEAKKLIPLPLDQVIIDWKVVAEARPEPLAAKSSKFFENGNGAVKQILTKQQPYLKVLLTGTAKRLVENFINIFKAADLNLLSLETEDFALTRSLIGNDQASIMLVDLGASTSTIILVQNGLPLLHRSLQHGSWAATKIIAEKLKLSVWQAEQVKRDLTQIKGQQYLLEIFQTALNPIINEIKYTYNLFQQQPGQKIEKVILTGGGALLPELPQFLANILGTKVYLGDPWARVMYPEELKPVLDVVGSRMSIAVGLAMREII
ncbi:MAG: pilus assembly protein PilM [Candidatus Buchananbacteria bacterium]